MSDMVAPLAEREATHGDYSVQAGCAQALKAVMAQQPNWHRLSPRQKESLEMIAVKQSRILCGDQNHRDSWVDIAGYAELGGGWKNGEAQVRSA